MVVVTSTHRQSLGLDEEARKVLWVGGTSALSRSYFDEQVNAIVPGQKLIFVICGYEDQAPAWCADFADICGYVSLNMFDAQNVSSLSDLAGGLISGCDTLILSIRLCLVTSGSKHLELATNLRKLFEVCYDEIGVRNILHVSSIAVADHMVPKDFANENDPLPPIEQLYSYDKFKRLSEDILNSFANERRELKYTSVRVGGIYSSNAELCFSHQWLGLHMRYSNCFELPLMDITSGRNICVAMRLLLLSDVEWKKCYYYTRTRVLDNPDLSPVSLSWYVRELRKAHGIQWYFDGQFVIPNYCIGYIFLILSWIFPSVGFLSSMAYLILAGAYQQTFDCSRIRADLPDLDLYEEDIRETFRREAAGEIPVRLKCDPAPGADTGLAGG